jgi:hypothetical protein
MLVFGQHQIGTLLSIFVPLFGEDAWIGYALYGKFDIRVYVHMLAS